MKITANVSNSRDQHQAAVQTNGQTQSLLIAPKAAGGGSAVNGGELLFLALATCYCNDIYREAAKSGIAVEQVVVSVSGEFEAAGQAARNVIYEARVKAAAPEQAIRDLMQHTDQVSEIQNSLRQATPVTLGEIQAVSSM